MHTLKIARGAAAGCLSVVLLFGSACSANVTGSAETSAGVSTSQSVDVGTSTTRPQIEYHPAGFTVPRGANVRLPTDVGELTMQVGDYFIVKPQEWFPDNRGTSGVGNVLQLAEATEDALTYQAIRPGSIVFAIGPVGHPGGCDQPGKSCADATPPPIVKVTVTK